MTTVSEQSRQKGRRTNAIRPVQKPYIEGRTRHTRHCRNLKTGGMWMTGGTEFGKTKNGTEKRMRGGLMMTCFRIQRGGSRSDPCEKVAEKEEIRTRRRRNRKDGQVPGGVPSCAESRQTRGAVGSS